MKDLSEARRFRLFVPPPPKPPPPFRFARMEEGEEQPLVELQQPGVLDTEMVQPALRMVATAAHTPEDMAEFGQVLREVVAEIVR